jgi:hypothetical protein
VLEARADFGQALGGYPASLIQGERIFGRFQFDIGAHSIFPKVHARLEVLHARIKRQFGGVPAKERADVRAFCCVEACHELIERFLLRETQTPQTNGLNAP